MLILVILDQRSHNSSSFKSMLTVLCEINVINSVGLVVIGSQDNPPTQFLPCIVFESLCSSCSDLFQDIISSLLSNDLVNGVTDHHNSSIILIDGSRQSTHDLHFVGWEFNISIWVIEVSVDLHPTQVSKIPSHLGIIHPQHFLRTP